MKLRDCRNCIGQKLALQEAQIMLSLLVKNFRVVPACDLEKVTMGHEVLMCPKNLFIKFVTR
jgi:cytochrome P450